MVTNLLDRLRLLSAVIQEPETSKRISRAAAIRMIADYKQRIFFQGLASDGGLIGQYSQNPFYQNPNALTGVSVAGITPEGKYGQKVFKNGKPHKTKYLTKGYAELRELTGRKNDKVDLNFSGSLNFSVKNEERGLTTVLTYSDAESALIMEGQEERFVKTIHEPTAEEMEGAEEAARLELLAILEELDA